MLAVVESPLGDVIFIDHYGFAWKGPTYNKKNPVPLEDYPPIDPDNIIVT